MAGKSKLLGNENHPGKGNPHLDQDGVPGQGVPSILGGIPPGHYQEGGVGPGGIPGLLGDPPGLFEPESVDITAPDSLNMEAGDEKEFEVTVENPEFSPEYDAVYFDFTIENINVEIGLDQFRTEDGLTSNQILGFGHDLGTDLDPSGFSVNDDGVVTDVTDTEKKVLSWDDANPDTNWDDLQITLTGVQEGDDLSVLFGDMSAV